MWRAEWEKKVARQLRKIPLHIQEKFRAWVVSVETDGLPETRKRPGYHDEPLKGRRKGQRSVRLSRAYRAIYVEGRSDSIQIVEVIEVSKHEY